MNAEGESTESRVDRDGFLSRFLEACDALPGRGDEMEVLGVSRSQLGRYRKGENEPSFLAVAALGEAAGVSLEWLATGQGAKEPSSSGGRDREDFMFRAVVERVYAYVEKRGYGVSPAELAELCMILLDLLRDDVAKDPAADIERYTAFIDFTIKRMDVEGKRG